MSTWLKIGLALVVVLAAILFFWSFDSGPDLPETPMRARPSVEPPATPAPSPTSRKPTATSSRPRPEEAPPDSRAVAPVATATLLGRCVDADTTAPLAGCAVQVTARQVHRSALGYEQMPADLEDFLIDSGEIRWRDPEPVSTGPDGRFRFELPGPPPVPIEITVRKRGRTPVKGRWKKLHPGTTEDVGDIPLARGTEILGRVSDDGGQTQPHVAVQLYRYLPGKSRFLTPRDFKTRSQENGRFRFPFPVPPGSWTVRVPGRYLACEPEIDIPAGAPQFHLDLVVKVLPSITGLVVDEAGQPVSGAWIDFHPHGAGSRYFANRTGRDGSFRLERRPEDPAGQVALIAVREGHEVVWRHGAYAWGTTGVKVVLVRGLQVPIQVVDADTGQSVERYGVRFFSIKKDQGLLHQPHRRLRLSGRHPDGRLVLPGVRRGPNVLLVQPMDGEHLQSPWRHFEVGAGGASSQIIPLVKPKTRKLLVVRKDGTPVEGSQVQLVRPPHGSTALDVDTEVGRPGRLEHLTHDRLALILFQGDTDDRGEVLLQGPPGERLALRILGPGHLPKVVNGVVVGDNAGRMRVEVTGGATFLGRIQPLVFLTRLRSGSGRDPLRPGIRLLKPGARGVTSSKAGLETSIEEDGQFRFASVSPGTWDIFFTCSLDSGPMGKGISHRVNQRIGCVRDLKLGETRRLDLDLSDWVPGHLEGRVFLNEKPLASRAVTFTGTRPDGIGPGKPVLARTVTTDDKGYYVLDLFPGLYRPRIQMKSKTALLFGNHLEAEHAIAVLPGAFIYREIHLRRGRLSLQVTGSDGVTPLPGIQLCWRFRSREDLTFTPETDRAGRLTLDNLPQGNLVFLTWPGHLAAKEPRREYLRENPKAWRQVLIQVGAVILESDREVLEKKLVLPAGAGY